MPPLPDAVVTTLKTDACAALAAIMIISSAHSELLVWAHRSLSPLNAGNCALDGDAADKSAGGQKAGVEVSKLKPRKTNGASGSNGVAKGNGATGAKKGVRAKGRHNPREAAAKHDQALLALMRANPGASVTAIIRMNRRPRNSTVLSLDRLERAGLIEHAGRGKWKVVDPGLLEVPAQKPAGWIEPLSANHKARHAADGRVRDELTMAAGAH
jgi:hypothetical protein